MASNERANPSGFRYANMMYSYLEQYEAEVDASALTDSSKKDYKMFAAFFVRWLAGDFYPGEFVS